MSETEKRHILSRFDEDLGSFRKRVLGMGELACEQIRLGADAVANCDIELAARVDGNFRAVRDRDIDLLEANMRLQALHQPVAKDLRFMMMLSRTAYDLERINQEALRLSELVKANYSQRSSDDGCELFDDVEHMGGTVDLMLRSALKAIAESDVELGISVVERHEQIERLSQGALRRLATYIMQDPRNMPRVVDATIALKGLERVAEHAISIARNLIFACSGKDVRYLNPVNLNPSYLGSS